MNFYCIVRNKNSKNKSLKLLEESCAKKNINFVLIGAGSYDFTKNKDLNENDLIYRIATSATAVTIEKEFLNNKCLSFYSDYKLGIQKNKSNSDYIIHKKEKGVPIIKTIFNLPTNKELLKKYVKYLNGFPIVVKAIGGSHGVGVIRIDSMESLLSAGDFLNSDAIQSVQSDYIMREFIPHTEQARLIVLGNKVIASKGNRKVSDDFRLNKGNIKELSKKYSSEIENTAVQAVKSLGWEFGGVDVLIDEKSDHYLAEVNLPCNFARTQLVAKVNIADMMVDYLIKKKLKK